MRRSFLLIVVFLVIFANFGAIAQGGISKEYPYGKELSESVVWPRPYRFSDLSDPFKPLIVKKEVIVEEKKVEEVKEVEEKLEARLMGTVVLGSASLALVEYEQKTSTFRKGDKIGEYKINRIENDRVMLSKNKKKIILKVGGKDE
jgi:hypothetical protein